MATQAEIEAAARAGYEEVRKDHPGWMPWENLSTDSPTSVRHAWIRFSQAALEAAERARWQPIETFKDGKRFLAVDANGEMGIISRHDPGGEQRNPRHHYECWVTDFNSPRGLPPILGQSLPSPPESK